MEFFDWVGEARKEAVEEIAREAGNATPAVRVEDFVGRRLVLEIAGRRRFLRLLPEGQVGEGESPGVRRWRTGPGGCLNLLGDQVRVWARLRPGEDGVLQGRMSAGPRSDVRLSPPRSSGTATARVGKVYVVNLDRSPDRWHRIAGTVLPLLGDVPHERIEAIDGGAMRGSRDGWDPRWLRRMRSIGAAGPRSSAGPVRTALALSHLAAARWMLEEGHEWAIVLEDDAAPSNWVFREGGFPSSYEVPEDAEVVWLHHRFQGAGEADPSTGMKPTARGIGTEAFLLSARMARRLPALYCPLLLDCDIQWSAFFHGLEDDARRRQVLGEFRRSGGIVPSSWCRSYCHPDPPFREAGASSAKFALDG